MTKFSADREADIAKVIKYYEETPGVKKSKVAAKFLVPYRLFKACLEGRPAQNTKGGDNKVLNKDQQGALRSYIDFLVYCGH